MADYRDDRRIIAEVDSRPSACTRGNVEVRSAAGSLTDEQLDAFSALAEKGAADIGRFTGVEPPKHIVIYLSPQVGISHTYTGSSRHQPRVFIDSDRVVEHTAPYLHELVHAVAGDGGAMWLDEGFAEWVASSVATTYGGYYAPVMSDANDRVDAQARAVLQRVRGTSEVRNWFTAEDPQLASQRERRNFYIVSHSFTKFLATTLGASRLIGIFRANEAHALAEQSGVSNEEWERRWVAELDKTEAVSTLKTIRR
jgi:hypothetical protein